MAPLERIGKIQRGPLLTLAYKFSHGRPRNFWMLYDMTMEVVFMILATKAIRNGVAF